MQTDGGFGKDSMTAAEDALLVGMKLSQDDLHAHINAALATPSGKILEKWLEHQCYMHPTPAPEPVHDPISIPMRKGRSDLFRILQWWKDPKNFKAKTEG